MTAEALTERRCMSNRKLRLADAGNTRDPALAVIIAKGYQVYFLPDSDEELFGNFWAIKEGRDFIASDPRSLLGLIALWEHTGDDWQALEGDFYDEIIDRAFPEEDAYQKMDEATFRQEMAFYRPFFEALNLCVPEPTQPLELFHLLKSLVEIINRSCED
jgi:hypothetical protein